jgi:uncharacterized protein YcbK (DUF882 family)
MCASEHSLPSIALGKSGSQRRCTMQIHATSVSSLSVESLILSSSLRSLPCSLLLMVIFTTGLVSHASAKPASQPVSGGSYQLHLVHTHTGERLNIVYRDGAGYDPQSLARLDRYLRDHRTSEVHEYDPRVFDLLYELTTALGNPDLEIDVVCGYRTPWSNEFLRAHGHGVARHSLHMQAMAIDIRIPGVATAHVRDAALALHRGGVGYYAASDFVHVDVGRVRRW